MEVLLQRTRLTPAVAHLRASSRRAGPAASRGQLRPLHLTCQAVAQDAGNGVAKPAAAAAAAGKKACSAPKAFKNILKFQVPPQSVRAFEDEWQRRASAMKHYEGFEGFSIKVEAGTYIVTSSWSSIPQWEAYSLGAEIRRSHLPSGIYQLVPGKGEGFPEDFVPFVDFKRPVDAKY